MHTKRPTGRRTIWLTLLLLGPGSWLSNLERMPSTGGLIISGPGSHGSTVGLLLSTGLLLQRFNHQILALPLVATHDASDRAMGRAGGWNDGWTGLSLGRANGLEIGSRWRMRHELEDGGAGQRRGGGERQRDAEAVALDGMMQTAQQQRRTETRVEASR
jgi:hypothetical protein